MIDPSFYFTQLTINKYCNTGTTKKKTNKMSLAQNQVVNFEEVTSLFGNGQPQSFSQTIRENKGIIISFISASLLNVITDFDQPYEIFIAVVLSMLLWYTIREGIRRTAIILSSEKGSENWQKEVVSFIDLISILMVMFFSQYLTDLATSEWKKAGFSKVDTIFVGIFFVSYAIAFIVIVTYEVDVQRVEDYIEDQAKKKK